MLAIPFSPTNQQTKPKKQTNKKQIKQNTKKATRQRCGAYIIPIKILESNMEDWAYLRDLESHSFCVCGVSI